MPVHKNTTCALQTGYKPTCLCIKTQHVHFKKAINPHACAQNTHPEPSIKYQNLLKSTCLCTKVERKVSASTWKRAPRRPSEENIVVHAPAQLRLARSHARHETKTKTKRSRSPGYRGSDRPD